MQLPSSFVEGSEEAGGAWSVEDDESFQDVDSDDILVQAIV